MQAITQELVKLLELGQQANYDSEAVTQLEHALQIATLAEDFGQEKELVVACLLHDIGHLLHHLETLETVQKSDDRHEEKGARYLQPYFSPAVTEPIRLHVPAKRYLCWVDKDYWDGLSPASKQSLVWQGGPFDEAQAATFIQQPYAKDAVQLRIWDDQAKVAEAHTPNLAHFVPIIEACAKN